MKIRCVLLAAGKGTRSGLSENKVFFRFRGRSILSRCIEALNSAGVYDDIQLVVSAQERDACEKLLAEEGTLGLISGITAGGAARSDSAYNGLCALPKDTDIVSVHDAARPFVSANVVRATVRDAREYGSGVISTPVIDTIKRIDPETEIVSTPDRSQLYAVQTPQTFDYKKLMAAYEAVKNTDIVVTDDSMIWEHMYGNVHLSVADDADMNVKMTMPKDFENRIPDMRVGSGYDAHRLKEGRKLILCGEDIPHSRGLDGHSDADVAVHALMDAMLGALALGDIGRHFPDSDMRYKGISSMLLLEHVNALIREKGYTVGNADVTIVAQKPKLAPHIPAMKENIARTLGIAPDRVNVKATTTEHMGFEGEEIGISAQAVVLLIGG